MYMHTKQRRVMLSAARATREHAGGPAVVPEAAIAADDNRRAHGAWRRPGPRRWPGARRGAGAGRGARAGPRATSCGRPNRRRVLTGDENASRALVQVATALAAVAANVQTPALLALPDRVGWSLRRELRHKARIRPPMRVNDRLLILVPCEKVSTL